MSDLLLAIDTCTRRASIALRDARVLRGEHTWECERQETARVADEIQSLLRASGVAPSALGAIAVATGPGSFTGVRCGLAIGKGMAVALGLPMIGVNAFDVLVRAQPDDQSQLWALLEIGRKRVAACAFTIIGGQRLSGEWRILSWPDAAAAIDASAWVCGDIPDGLAGLLVDARIAPAPYNIRRAGWLAEIAYARWRAGQVDDPLTLSAIYPPEDV
jgi:tRNA threonylcarbamoyladenosine biosynthesis protein TsaB